MKVVCRCLGLARSHVHDLHHRLESWVDGRTQRTPAMGEQLVSEIRHHITEL